jgi:hypothetical protein
LIASPAGVKLAGLFVFADCNWRRDEFYRRIKPRTEGENSKLFYSLLFLWLIMARQKRNHTQKERHGHIHKNRFSISCFLFLRSIMAC